MKRKLYFLVTFILSVICFTTCFIGCKQNKPLSGDYVIIVANDVEDCETVIDYMKKLREDGKLSFESETSAYGEYITSINGKKQAGNSYWMLYTSDLDYASTSYTVTYEGRDYGQAITGASSLPVKEGETYIWFYESY